MDIKTIIAPSKPLGGLLLPFLKKQDGASPGITMKTRTPDEKPDTDEDDPKAGTKAAFRALMSAIRSGNEDAGVEALHDIFAIFDSQPHEEGEHVEPHSYDAQNQKAGEQD